MKGRNLIFTGAVAAIVGVLMLLFRSNLANGGIVLAAGALFVGAGILNMSVFLGSRDKDGHARMGAVGTAFGWIASAAAVVLGLAMLIFSKAFVALTGFMFAVLLLFAALFQLFLLLFGSRPTRLSNWFFLVPTALVAAAVYIFMRKPDTAGEEYDMLFVGISFALFGVFTMIEGSLIGRNNHMALKRGTTYKDGEKASAQVTEKTPEEHLAAAPEASENKE